MNLKGRNLLKQYHGPGIWEDMDGRMHFALPDILQYLGVPVTAENQRELSAVLEKALREEGITVPIQHRLEPEKQFGEG